MQEGGAGKNLSFCGRVIGEQGPSGCLSYDSTAGGRCWESEAGCSCVLGLVGQAG